MNIEKTSMRRPEKFLIVSLGSIGRRHLKNLRLLKPDAEIAVWRQHTAHPGSELPEGADFQFTSLDEVLAFKPDVAIVASPAHRHVETALLLARAGVHLLLEKPISNALNGLDELISICDEKKLTLMVGYNLRFYPSLVETRRMLDEGAIGRVLMVRAEVGQYLPDWRPASDYRQGVTAQQALGGGVLLELSHELDYLYWMFGMPDFVTACGGRLSDLEIDVEDAVELILEYAEPRRMVNVHLDMVQRAPLRRCRLIGENGTVVWDAIADRIECYSVATRQWQTFDQYALEDRNQMYLDELSHFFDCVANARTPLITGRQGRDVLAIVEAAKASLETGRKIGMEQYVGR